MLDNVLSCCFHLFHSTNLACKTEQVDETFCIMVVIQITGCEACNALVVQRIWRSGSCLDDVTFVQLEFHFTGYVLLCAFDECLYCLAKRSKPFSFVYDLSKFVAKICF